ncbi:hypothetical protein ACR79N_08315 [Sphingobacterium siyangense]|uniref:hypothetical protein n=2 Tax=Sphingobacteriaceae TaxID=84566 RepID=UPI003DA20191
MRKFWVYFLNRLVLNGRGEIDKLLFVGNLSKFEKEIETKIGRSDTMGTQEYLLDKAEKKGIQKGIEKGKREEAIAIALEFKKMGLPIADIAKGTGLSIEEIEKL